MKQYDTVTQIGLDVHRKFSLASLRDGNGKLVARQRLEHSMDRQELRKGIGRWPAGTPVVLEATFGWGWLSDELVAGKMAPHLASSRKVAGWRFLSLLVTDAQALGESSRQTLKQELMLLDQLRLLIARCTRQFRATLKRSATGQRLMTLPGVSTVLAYSILAEIGQIERFANSRCLLRYSLLAPQADDSGEERAGKPIGRYIGHAGRATLQWAWIEAAHGAVRKSAAMRKIYNRRTDNGKQDRGRSYITVANHLCRIGYALWKKGTVYQEVPPARPGSARAKQELDSSGNGPALRPYGCTPELIRA